MRKYFIRKPKLYSLIGASLAVVVLIMVGLDFVGTEPPHASAHEANTSTTSCTVTFNNPGFPPNTYHIYLDDCAKQIIKSGGNAKSFSVVWIDTGWFFSVPNPAQLSQEAQQAVRDGINKYLDNFRQAYTLCHNTNASLQVTSSFGDKLKDTGNPSQFIIDSMPSAQFQLGC